jgi:hypothetical protein
MSEQSNDPADEMRSLLEDLIEDYEYGRVSRSVYKQARDAIRRYDESKKGAPQNLQLEQERDSLRAALGQVEHVPTYDGWRQCPWCDEFEEEGHGDDCVRQAGLGLKVYVGAYAYLEQRPARIWGATVREAVEKFFQRDGGLRANPGRCIVVEGQGERSRWACVLLYNKDPALFQTDEAGDLLPDQPRLNELSPIFLKSQF